jgi:hypothetical protein
MSQILPTASEDNMRRKAKLASAMAKRIQCAKDGCKESHAY